MVFWYFGTLVLARLASTKNMPGLLSLPDEILEIIVRKARATSLLAVRATCRRLRALRIDYLDLSIVVDDGTRRVRLVQFLGEDGRNDMLRKHRDNVRAIRPLKKRDAFRIWHPVLLDEKTHGFGDDEFLRKTPCEYTTSIHHSSCSDLPPLFPVFRYRSSRSYIWCNLNLPYHPEDVTNRMDLRCRMVRDGVAVIEGDEVPKVAWVLDDGPDSSEFLVKHDDDPVLDSAMEAAYESALEMDSTGGSGGIALMYGSLRVVLDVMKDDHNIYYGDEPNAQMATDLTAKESERVLEYEFEDESDPLSNDLITRVHDFGVRRVWTCTVA